MIIFTRKEFVIEERIYTLPIDENFVKNYIDRIERLYDTRIELTEKDFEDVLAGEDNDTLNTELTRTYVDWQGNPVTYKTTIRDIILEWINDDAWDADYEVNNSETEDVYDDYTIVK